jgi:hypothetical protein
MHKNSVLASQETHYVTTAKTGWLMLFRETIAIYCGNHRELTDTLWHNAKFYYVRAGGTYSNQWALKG